MSVAANGLHGRAVFHLEPNLCNDSGACVTCRQIELAPPCQIFVHQLNTNRGGWHPKPGLHWQLARCFA